MQNSQNVQSESQTGGVFSQAATESPKTQAKMNRVEYDCDHCGHPNSHTTREIPEEGDHVRYSCGVCDRIGGTVDSISYNVEAGN